MGRFCSPEEVIDIWLSEGYEKVYNATSKDFQEIVTLEQFIELSNSFNKGVKKYQLETKTVLQNLTHYVWSDDKREQVEPISVAIAQRPGLNTFVLLVAIARGIAISTS